MTGTPGSGTARGGRRPVAAWRAGATWQIVAAVAIIVCAIATALFVVRLIDRKSGPPIVILDPQADATIVVAVAGEVATPGVYTFPTGARVDDALRRAGGASAQADLSTFNLARRLDDGEQLVIPSRQPTAVAPPAGTTPVASPPGPSPTTAPTAPGSLVNINTADVATLMTLPEIGEARAAAIIAYREANGPFASVDELVNVDGISERIVDLLRPLVTVGP